MRSRLSFIFFRNSIFLSRSKLKVFYFFKGKVFFLRKGFYWRKMLFSSVILNKHVGVYLSSRKPLKRINKLNKKR